VLAQRSRRVSFGGAALAFSGGVLLLVFWPALPNWPDLLALAGTAAVLLAVPATRLPGCAVTGLVWALHCASLADRALPRLLHDTELSVTGHIASIPRVETDVVRFRFAPETTAVKLPARIRATWFRPSRVPAAGERWRLVLRLRPPHGGINPYGFDYPRWLYGEGLGAIASVQSGRPLAQPEPLSVPRLRQNLAQWVSTVLPADAAALARALAVGDRSRLSDAQWRAMTATGTGHLLAISGLHVGLVAALGFAAGRAAVRAWPALAGFATATDTGLLLAAIVGTGYAVLAGMVLPTQRALIMLLVTLAALRARRRVRTGHALVLALTLLLLAAPTACLSAGFWLSFAAVAWLWFAFAWRVRAPGRWRTLVRAQTVLTLGLLPLQAAWFQQFSLLMPVANLVLIPLTGALILPLLLAALLAHFALPPLGDLLLLMAGTALGWVGHALQWCAAHGGALQLSLAPPDTAAAILAVTGAAWLMLPRGVRVRHAGWLWLVPMLWTPDPAPPPGGVELLAYDLGQGQAVAVRTHRHALLYDTGPGDGRGRNRVAGSIAPQLRRWNAIPLSALVVSHADLDHAGGLRTARQQLRPEWVVGSAPAMRMPCRSGDRWRWDGVEFRLLHPGRFLPYLGNDSSCVLQITTDAGAILLPGDITMTIEARLLRRYAGPPARVLLVPHHGSATSALPAWLDAVAPELALVSAGQWNRFDHPAAEIRRRYEATGARFINTANCGAIRVRLDAVNGLQWQTLADSTRRWWRNSQAIDSACLR